ncbi:uncharacterized protein LOC142639551 [Castanea sativa]|uniref:uncharacterized protein LOC142639551 n=1 Tax=Castanea sativa TaxID=21020 RepID=UPI003F64B32A
MNLSQHIQKVLENFNSDQIASNRLRLKASIDVVKVLAFQGLAFRGRDESSDSINCGNFLEILDLVVSYNEYVVEAIEKAPKNSSYKSPKIQKEILQVFSNKVKKEICEEIGDAKFCLIVDEARDDSMKEQMAIVIRFVDKDGFVQELFLGLLSIVNVVGASCKRTKQLKKAYANQIAYFVEIDELETRRGLNQISTLQRAGDTSWGSHLRSISSLEIMKITDALCQALQCQTQDILNVMNFVSSTKALIQNFRDKEWGNLFTTMKSFCEARDIDVPDMNARYVERGGLARYQQDDFTIEHHYRVDIFYATIDFILQELNHRFSEHAVELLNLSSALDPKEAKESFRIFTATTKRAFSAMNIIKNRLHKKMEDDFLMDSMIFYIEKEIAAKFGTKS